MRQKSIEEKHQFAFFYQNLKTLQELGGTLIDIDLCHRIARVVKLVVGEVCIFFNQQEHLIVKLLKIEKRSLQFSILSSHKNNILHPHITFMLPLLKREALEESVYSLAEIGVNEIQLIVTQKSRHQITEKDLHRLQKIVIAAAEQSKHFAYPKISISQCLKDYVVGLSEQKVKVVFDVFGKNFLKNYKDQDNASICLTVGPEGSFTQEELKFLKESGFESYALTKTVLRSLQAVAIGAALYRL